MKDTNIMPKETKFRARELAWQDTMAHFGFVQMSTKSGREKIAKQTDKDGHYMGKHINKFFSDRFDYWLTSLKQKHRKE